MFKVAILQKRSINEQIDKNIETIISNGTGKKNDYDNLAVKRQFGEWNCTFDILQSNFIADK